MAWTRLINRNKIGSSSKPIDLCACAHSNSAKSTIVWLQRTLSTVYNFVRPYFRSLLSCLLIIIITSCYYNYLNYTYIVDEAFDLNGTKEMSLEEKFTIRTLAPIHSKLSDLKNFIVHYSICPVVNEISVAWQDLQNSYPHDSYFPYTSSHGKVTFDSLGTGDNAIANFYKIDNIKTKGVLLLDIDVMMSCDDLRFVHSVWRSSYYSIVGVFPRNLVGDLSEYEYQSPSSVFWRKSYSVLLASAAMLNVNYLKTFSEAKEVHKFLSQQPHCMEYLPSIWVAHTSPYESPPVWVETSAYIDSAVSTPRFPIFNGQRAKDKTLLSNEERSHCINQLVKTIGLQKPLPVSYMKSVQAKNSIFW